MDIQKYENWEKLEIWEYGNMEQGNMKIWKYGNIERRK